MALQKGQDAEVMRALVVLLEDVEDLVGDNWDPGNNLDNFIY